MATVMYLVALCLIQPCRTMTAKAERINLTETEDEELHLDVDDTAAKDSKELHAEVNGDVVKDDYEFLVEVNETRTKKHNACRMFHKDAGCPPGCHHGDVYDKSCEPGSRPIVPSFFSTWRKSVPLSINCCHRRWISTAKEARTEEVDISEGNHFEFINVDHPRRPEKMCSEVKKEELCHLAAQRYSGVSVAGILNYFRKANPSDHDVPCIWAKTSVTSDLMVCKPSSETAFEYEGKLHTWQCESGTAPAVFRIPDDDGNGAYVYDHDGAAKCEKRNGFSEFIRLDKNFYFAKNGRAEKDRLWWVYDHGHGASATHECPSPEDVKEKGWWSNYARKEYCPTTRQDAQGKWHFPGHFNDAAEVVKVPAEDAEE